MINNQTTSINFSDLQNGSVFLIDKEKGKTSFGVIRDIRKKINIKKVGHAGTLDPAATGLLIVCTGKKTKEIYKFQDLSKTYIGKITLGISTPSMDAETEPSSVKSLDGINEEEIEKTRKLFIGEIKQIPPMYSAIKHKGQSLYKYARKGIEIKRDPRKVSIYDFEITNISLPEISFKIKCSKGTYIRVIANDFGDKLGCGGYLSELRRSQIGDFKVEDALTFNDLQLLQIVDDVKNWWFIMKIINFNDKDINSCESVVTIGTFDGLHLGHLEIIEELKKKSAELGLCSVVLTFYPHPRTVVAKDSGIKLLTPLEEKKLLFRNLGIDYLYIINFTKEFSKKTYKEFIDDIVIKEVRAKHLIIGYDHKFGKDRTGDKSKLVEYTRENGIEMTVVSARDISDGTVSSTKIRDALLEGELDLANKMLGRYYSMLGTVVEGAKRGRTLGFPTANINPDDENKLIPRNGVYFVRVNLNDKVYYGVANIGLRPTFNHAIKPITEVFIFDFDRDIYGEKLTLEFLSRLRNEIKFNSKEELENQIKLDVEKAKQKLKEIQK